VNQDSADPGEGAGAGLSERLMSTLEPIVGADKIRASVNVAYDQGTTEESQEKYDPSVSALLSDQKSEDQAGGSPVPAGVPGTASNVPTKKEPKSDSTVTSSQSSKTESATYGVNKTVVHTVTPAGRVARVTAAILIDDEMVRSVQKGKVSYTRRKRTQEELDKIRELAEAVIGSTRSVATQSAWRISRSITKSLPRICLERRRRGRRKCKRRFRIIHLCYGRLLCSRSSCSPGCLLCDQCKNTC